MDRRPISFGNQQPQRRLVQLETRRAAQPLHTSNIKNQVHPAPAGKQLNSVPAKTVPVVQKARKMKPSGFAMDGFKPVQKSVVKQALPAEKPRHQSTPPRPAAASLPPPQKQSHKIRPAHKAKKAQYAFMAAGLVVFLSGMIVTVMGVKTNHEVAAQAQQTGQVQAAQSTEDSDVHPDESEPDPKVVKSYSVAPDLPKRIMIPKLNVNTRILGMTLKADGQLKAPGNIYDAGWYTGSSKPGQQGAMLIDGHVSGPTRPGVFKNLPKMVTGDKIQVERGDGAVFNYKVVKTQSFEAANTDMGSAITPIVAGKSGLNIITCSGKYDKKSGQYTERTIVYATLAE